MLAAHELDALAGDAARARDYSGTAHRRIESLLPARLRPLIPLLILDRWGTLEVEIGPSLALPADKVENLQELCLRRHRGEALGDTPAKRLSRWLAKIDPRSVRVLVCVAPGASGNPALLTHPALYPTFADVGSWAAGPSQSGLLPVGKAELVDGGRLAVEPLFTFRPPFQFVRDI